MGIRERWRELWSSNLTELEPARRLELASGFNVRELGGYMVEGGATSYRRFIRSGGLDTLSMEDQKRLHSYGVRLVVDLRGNHEVGISPDKLTNMRDVRYLHAPLYDINLSDPALEKDDAGGDYWALGYLTMLANREAVRKVFSFFATAAPSECVLFHCAAGMDRTGVIAMLVLGLAGATRERIVADYCYSFASTKEVDRVVYEGKRVERRELELRLEAVNTVLDRIRRAYGTVEDYLRTCGVSDNELGRVRAHLMDQTFPAGE